jgi:hypothetical protein
MVEAPCYKPEGRELESRRRHWSFSIYLIFPAKHGPAVYSASNRNVYQNIFLGVRRGRSVRLTTSLPSVQKIWDPRHITSLQASTEIVLLFTEYGAMWNADKYD